jgi:hypothetical protein
MAPESFVLGVQQAVFLKTSPEQGSGAESENSFACLFCAVEAKLDLAL